MFLLTLFLMATTADAKIVGKTVEYSDKGVAFEGYLAFDDAKKGKLPAILVVHEWTGLGSYVKKRADQLAAMGYLAFAADIYGKGVRPQPPEAGAIAGKYKGDRALFRERLLLAYAEMLKSAKADAKRTAAIGYCFGGTGVLELARAGADLRGVVSFHGGLDSPKPEDGKNIKAKVLVLHGADDPYVPEADVKKFEDEMRAAKVDWELVKYSGAVHAFTNPDAGNDPSKGAAYNAVADRRSWEQMKLFFAEALKP